MPILPLPKYRLVLDQRHLDGSIDVVPIERDGVQEYELPFVGRYGCVVTVESQLLLPKYELVCLVAVKGRVAFRVPGDSRVSYALTHGSSQFYFFGTIVLLLECDLSNPISAKALPPVKGATIRHTYMISHLENILRGVAKDNCPARMMKFGQYLIYRLLKEYYLLDQKSKSRLAECVNNSWGWMCDLFRTGYESGPHVDLMWKLNEESLIKHQ